jgi:cobalt-zinc-cadmium resistance protein CzcA
LAIAIGLMVDATVVVVENVFHKLGQAGNSRGERIRTVLSATVEVATPTIFGIAIIILVFLPLMTLQGIEGKMFGPLALTIAMALAISLAVSLFLSPVLCSYFLKGGADHDTKLIGFLKRHYLRLLDGATARNRLTLAVAVALLIGSLGLFPFLGKSFMPTMKEGALTPQINRVPSISWMNPFAWKWLP